MRILLDHNVPKRMRNSLPDHTVLTAKEMGWAELANGDLLSAAESENFELMITCDQNLSYQQNLRDRKLALIVLDTNNWKMLKGSLLQVAGAVGRAKPGNSEVLAVRGYP